METPEIQEPHPHEIDDALNDKLYNVARKVDKILNREPVANHAAILGMIQVTTQRRMHDHEQRQKAEMQAQQRAQQEMAQDAARRRQFSPN